MCFTVKYLKTKYKLQTSAVTKSLLNCVSHKHTHTDSYPECVCVYVSPASVSFSAACCWRKKKVNLSALVKFLLSNQLFRQIWHFLNFPPVSGALLRVCVSVCCWMLGWTHSTEFTVCQAVGLLPRILWRVHLGSPCVYVWLSDWGSGVDFGQNRLILQTFSSCVGSQFHQKRFLLKQFNLLLSLHGNVSLETLETCLNIN